MTNSTRLYGLEYSLGIHNNRPSWIELNFFRHPSTVVGSTVPSPFAQQSFWSLLRRYHPGSNPESMSSRITLRCIFICAAFKSHTGWSNAQRVSAPTDAILPNQNEYHTRLELLWSRDIRVANENIPKYWKTFDLPSYRCVCVCVSFVCVLIYVYIWVSLCCACMFNIRLCLKMSACFIRYLGYFAKCFVWPKYMFRINFN